MHAESSRVDVVEGILEDLLAHDLACAPRVAARLIEMLDGDLHTIRAVAVLLDPAERAGTRSLPRPLPVVAPVAERFAELALSSGERALLLTAALSFDDEVGPVLRACGREETDAPSLSRHLRVHAGRFRFVEQRLALWLFATTSAAETADAHRRLAEAYGDDDGLAAVWHRARGAVLGDSDAARRLMRAAEQSADGGLSELALQLATEAVTHMSGADHAAARLVAGEAAVGAGLMVEAVACLAGLFPDADESLRLRGLTALLVAQTHLQGAVPDVARFRPQGDTREDWLAWSRAAAFGAALCAGRGDRAGAYAWLDALREGAARADAARRLRDPVVAFVWLLLGESEADDVCGTGPMTGVVLDALRSALEDDIDRGLQILTTGDAGILSEDDPFIAGFERSELIRANRVVIEVLLRFWRGDVGGARSRLCEASLTLPVTVPFAGLGVILSRRLDLAVLGRLGAFALSLTAALPAPSRPDQLVDRAIRAHLARDENAAGVCLRLWLDRGGPQNPLAVPGLDESSPVGAERLVRIRHRVEPPEMALGRLLRMRASSSADAVWRNEGAEVAEAARSIISPFERARVEEAIATRALVDGDIATGRLHLRAAWQLFEESGATAWAEAVTDRLDHLCDGDVGVSVDGMVASMRRRWELILTPRELEVALLAAQGDTNRDIAAGLNVSIRTVEVHLGRAFSKLGVRSRIDLVLLGHRGARHG